MSDLFCPHCKGFKRNDFHRCPPQWLVKHEDDNRPFEEMQAKPIYAAIATDAAETYAHSHLSDWGDSPSSITVLVCNYPAMNQVTKVDVQAELVLQCTGTEVDTMPYTAFAEDEESEDANV